MRRGPKLNASLRIGRYDSVHLENQVKAIFLVAVFALSVAMPDVTFAQVSTAKSCPSDMSIFSLPTQDEVCGPVPAMCSGNNCGAAAEEQSRHQQCRIQYYKDDKERKEHNALVKRCTGEKKSEPNVTKPSVIETRQQPAPTPSRIPDDILNAARQKAGQSVAVEKQKELIIDKVSKAVSARDAELKAEREEVDRLNQEQKANKEKVWRELNGAVQISCRAFSRHGERYLPRLNYCLSKYCRDFVSNGRINAGGCMNRYWNKWQSASDREDRDYEEDWSATNRVNGCADFVRDFSDDIRNGHCSNQID